MINENPKVNWFFEQEKVWKTEFELLRKIVLESQLTEEMKWGVPCYALEGKNVVLIHGFKNYCALLFFKGVLLKDPNKVLIQQTEYVLSARQIRFTSLKEISDLQTVIKSYIQEAITIEKLGLEIKEEKPMQIIPVELETKFKENPLLKTSFEALTPGRQRAYVYYFSGAKQAKTRIERIEKFIPKILLKKGLED